MCGIAGLVSLQPQPVQWLASMANLVRHRGPDDEGYVLFAAPKSQPIACGGPDTPVDAYRASVPYAPTVNFQALAQSPAWVALAHRRLSIVDLSPLGHQPMSYGEGRYWIVYNGEVYNHSQLRCELESLGRRFFSHSDTEVILAAYAHWGADCLHRFNGMFALAIFDCQQNTLFLARDRFGVKPLYYWISPRGALAFASEIKQFSVLPEWCARINGQRAYDFLAFGLSDHTDEAMFAGVYQLPPGHYATLHCDKPLPRATQGDGRLRVDRWYQLRPALFGGDYASACTRFYELFSSAVSLRLRADVPVGSCLSGGLDSSSIVCIMNRMLHAQNATAQQKTFSACAEVARFDERKWIDVVVGATGIDAHYVYPALDVLFDELATITWHQDEPFGSTSIYAQWNVFRLAASNGVTVMLDGQGADEQLAGYHTFFGPHLAGLFRQGRWLAMLREMQGMKSRHGYGIGRSLQYLAGAMVPEPIKDRLRQRTGRSHTHPEWLRTERLGCTEVNPFQLAGAGGANSVQELSIAQLTASNLQMLLHWEDRDSMAHSIESRVPFLDYRLVEFVLGLPDSFKLNQGVTKRVLRDAMVGVLPDPVRTRMDKLGFVTPEEVWIREREPHLFRRKLSDAVQAADGILDANHCSAYLDKMVAGEIGFNFTPWRMINFGQWIKTFSVRV